MAEISTHLGRPPDLGSVAIAGHVLAYPNAPYCDTSFRTAASLTPARSSCSATTGAALAV